ncbi:amidase [Haladaptatus caseinilyticus]|uniref:amidase n=1 Tax=Haladaptatus caseinilyticus TaxID=2993314 RepID=UPI00224B29FA|nr:amidase [Haladaptatus caseinilyticus]
MIAEEKLFQPIDELGDGLRNGEYTATELTRSYLDRLERVGPELNAVVTVMRERALETAAKRDAELAAGTDRGPLHGIPYGAKDLLAAKGGPTTWGAEPYRNQTFDYDATVVNRLEEAGAILIAKLAMVELAGGFGYNQADASFTGPTRNPWNPSAWTCGSSSGPGAAVPAGLVGFAIGSETWGSILCPSSFSGVSGFRPTYGRVSRYGAMTLSYTMDKIGPLCRSARGCERVFRAIAGFDPKDDTSVEKPLEIKSEATPNPDIAVLTDAGKEEQESVRENYNQSLNILSEFATITEITLPDLPYSEVAGLVIDAESAAAFEDLVKSGETDELRAPSSQIGGYSQQVVLAKDYLKAMRVRTKIQEQIDDVLAPYDALVTPARQTVANPIKTPLSEYFGRYGGPSISAAANVAGLPGVTVPNGFGARDLPTGLAFTGRAFSDVQVLDIAQQYQAQTDHIDYSSLEGGLSD